MPLTISSILGLTVLTSSIVGLTVLLLLALTLSTASGEKDIQIGRDVCICSPSTFVFTLELNNFVCPEMKESITRNNNNRLTTITENDGISEIACFIVPLDFGTSFSIADYIPIQAESIEVLELDMNSRALKVKNYEGPFFDGASITFSSIVTTDQITKLSQIPGGLQINSRLKNAANEMIIHSFSLEYNTHNCNLTPIFDVGAQGGPYIFSYLTPARSEYCPAIPTSTPSSKPSTKPTQVATDLPSTSPTTSSPTPCQLDECGVCDGPGKFTCCDGTRVCDSADCPQSKPVSICFALDESGSVCSIDSANNCDDLKINAGRPNPQCDYLNNCPKFNDSTKTFAKDIITSIDRITETKFAVVTFARNSNRDASLAYAESTKRTIEELEYSGGTTNTQAAIRDCRLELEEAPDDHIKYIIMVTDGRPTNNRDNNPLGSPCRSCQEQAYEEAEVAKSMGMSLITIGVESIAFDGNFLEDISSPGLNFMVGDYDELVTIEDNISSAANVCLDPTSISATNNSQSSIIPSNLPSLATSNPPTSIPSIEISNIPSNSPSFALSNSPTLFPTTNNPTPCQLDECGICNGPGKFTCCDGTKVCDSADCPQSKPVSICFALDESGSVCSIDNANNCDNLKDNIGTWNPQCDYLNNCPKFNDSTKTFAKDIITSIDRITETKFAVVTFARNSNRDSSLAYAYSAKRTIDELEYSGGTTNTQAAIRDCRLELEQAPDDHIKYIIMVTDGRPTNNRSNNPIGSPCRSCQEQAYEEAEVAKNMGMSLITIGVESIAFDGNFLEDISSPGLNFMVGNYDELVTIEDNISSAANVCL